MSMTETRGDFRGLFQNVNNSKRLKLSDNDDNDMIMMIYMHLFRRFASKPKLHIQGDNLKPIYLTHTS